MSARRALAAVIVALALLALAAGALVGVEVVSLVH